MSDATRVALLIDADNLSADVIEQVVERVKLAHGAIHVRRAYCGLKKAAEHEALFKRHSIRPMVNLPSGKNSTDIAMAVDAMDVAWGERPDVVVLASSDSDYAPLVIRLREAGCRVEGYGQEGKTGDEVREVYDSFEDLVHRKAGGSARKAPARKSRTRTARPADDTEQDADTATAEAPAKPAARSRRGRSATAKAAPPPAPALPPQVQVLLDAVPQFAAGLPVSLGDIGEPLRKAGILSSRSMTPSKLLKKLSDYFVLEPADRPKTATFAPPR